MAPVAQHGDPVRQSEDLLETVRNVDDAQAALAQPAQHGEQALHLESRQRRRRLVQDQHPRVDGERARDLDHLLLGDAQAGDRGGRGDPHAQLVEQRLDGAHHLAAPQEQPAALPAQPDVLGDAQFRHEREFLINDADAAQPNGQRIAGWQGPAVEQDLARVRRDRAAEHLDQRGLAGAVLADERMDFPGRQLEIHLVYGTGAAVELRESRGHQQAAPAHRRFGARRRHFPPSVCALMIDTSTETTGGTRSPARCFAIMSIAVRPIFFGSCTTSAFKGPPARIASRASGEAS